MKSLPVGLLIRACVVFVMFNSPTAGFGQESSNEMSQKTQETQAKDEKGSLKAKEKDNAKAKDNAKEKESPSRLSDKPIPLQTDDVPERPRLLLELGDKFLGSGALGKELKLPTGAIWRPSFWVFGQYRTAVQTFENGLSDEGEAVEDSQISEWVNRLDIFGNLKLSGTERLVIGFRPLDRNNRFTGYLWQPTGEFDNQFNAVIRTLFFEGDFGEIFPNLDIADTRALDIGFAVGRQSLLFQEGILVNTGGLGNLDAIGLVRNNLQLPGTSNVRLTALYGWDNVFRDDNREDPNAQLFGLFTESDFPFSTVELDLIYIESDKTAGDAFFAGIRGVQRFGFLNNTFMVNTSAPFNGETPQTSRGTLLFNQLSWIPTGTHDLVYLNAFWGIDQFSSAIRGPDQGGPLGRTGILFAAVGLGGFGAALGNSADDAAGGSLGYQMFFDDLRKQLVLELGGRKNTISGTPLVNRGAAAIGARYQQAIGQHYIPRIDIFGTLQEDRNPGFGARLELLVRF